MTRSAHHSVLEPSPFALAGGVLAVVSAFLAWDDMAGVAYDDAFKVPLRFLWQIDHRGGFGLGLPLVIVAAVAALFSVSPLAPVVFLRRLGGVALLGAVALFVVQLGRRSGWDDLDVGLGPWLTGAGGILLLLAPAGLWPLARRRTGGHAATGDGRGLSTGSSERPRLGKRGGQSVRVR